MKNKAVKLFLVLLLVLAFVCTLVACNPGSNDNNNQQPGDDNSTPTTYALAYSVGEGAVGAAPAGGNYAAGASVTLAAESAFSGVSKTGWHKTGLTDGSNSYQFGGSFTMPSHAVTLTVVWEQDAPPTIKHSVTFDPTSNSDMQAWTVDNIVHGTTISAPTAVPTYNGADGKKFHYWASEEGRFSDDMPINSDMTFEAVYHWTVSFDLNGASGTMEDAWVSNWGAGYTTPELGAGVSYSGKTFGGWSYDGATYTPGDKVPSANNSITLVAVWDDEPVVSSGYKVEFGTMYYAEGTNPTTMTDLKTDDPITLPANPYTAKSEYSNYEFKGWYVQALGSNSKLYQPGDVYTIGTSDVKFMAKWEKKADSAPDNPTPGTGTYMLTYVRSDIDGQLGSISAPPTGGSYEAGTTITTAAADCMTFAHRHLTKWRVKKLGTGGEWENDDALGNINPGASFAMPSYSIKLVAVWQANAVTVSFNANGGSGTMAPVEHDYDSNMNMLGSSKKFDCTFTAPVGKAFQGWATSPNGLIVLCAGKDPKAMKCNEDNGVSADDTLTLYAIWDKQSQGIEQSALAGVWTSSAKGYTLVVRTVSVNNNDFLLGVLTNKNGKYFVQVLPLEGYVVLYDGDASYIITSFDADKGTMSISPNDCAALGFAINFDSHTSTLNNANLSDFAGTWKRSDTTQKWVITNDGVYVKDSSSDKMNPAIGYTFGDDLVLMYDLAGFPYIYVLNKDGNDLKGYFDCNKDDNPVLEDDIVLSPYATCVLYVDGVPNQTVVSGNGPDMDLFPTPDKDKVFVGWVYAADDTPFDEHAAITGDVYVKALYKQAMADVTFYGNCTTPSKGFLGGGETITSITVNTDTNTYKYTLADSSTQKTAKFQNDLSNETYKPTAAGNDAFYIEVKIGNIAYNLLIAKNFSKLYLCNNTDDSVLDGGEFTLDAPAAHVHDFTKNVSATWTTDGSKHWHVATCSCGDTKKVDEATHNCTVPSNAAWEKDATKHWHVATCVCGKTEIQDEATHDCVVPAGAAWESNDTDHWKVGTCECGATENKNSGKHNCVVPSDATWEKNASDHWHIGICECGKTQEKDNDIHHYGDPVVQGEDNVYTCEDCGYKKTVPITHEHDFTKNVSTTWTTTEDSSTHWHVATCSCGDTKKVDEATHNCTVPSNAAWEKDATDHWKVGTCECGATDTKDEATHDYTVDKGYGHDANGHWTILACECGKTQDQTSVGHDWNSGTINGSDNTKLDFTCTTCGETKQEDKPCDHFFSCDASASFDIADVSIYEILIDFDTDVVRYTVAGNNTPVKIYNALKITADIPAIAGENGYCYEVSFNFTPYYFAINSTKTALWICNENDGSIVEGSEFSSDRTHSHSFAKAWTTTDGSDYHWHVATCDHTNLISGKVGHNWGEGVVNQTDNTKLDFSCPDCHATKQEDNPNSGSGNEDEETEFTYYAQGTAKLNASLIIAQLKIDYSLPGNILYKLTTSDDFEAIDEYYNYTSSTGHDDLIASFTEIGTPHCFLIKISYYTLLVIASEDYSILYLYNNNNGTAVGDVAGTDNLFATTPPHMHTFGTDWVTTDDSETHWHPATCEHTDLKGNEEEHTWNDGEVNGSVKTFTCTKCEATKEEPITADIYFADYAGESEGAIRYGYASADVAGTDKFKLSNNYEVYQIYIYYDGSAYKVKVSYLNSLSQQKTADYTIRLTTTSSGATVSNQNAVISSNTNYYMFVNYSASYLMTFGVDNDNNYTITLTLNSDSSKTHTFTQMS